jgi:cobalamin biosynthesis Mg chelatase CobN
MATVSKVKAVSATVHPAAAMPAVSANAPRILTVVVLDAKSQPVSGASVSITPSDASAATNAAGEAQFTLGAATKYEVTASNGNSTVTVPYYVTANGATRLIVNPVYVKTVEAQRHHSSGFGSSFITTGGIILVIVIILVVGWKLFRRK